MSQIKTLDQNTINHIAAGEVIDRPSSIVKELLENAIDADATQISVEIKDGGTSLIRVTDNGSGIAKDDIQIAFKRHTTSKIKDALDLATVSSLGFRGEALSSIAAVCQVEMVTKTSSDVTGYRYQIEGGEEKSFDEIGVPDGTTFIIRNIFFNTPARRKFLKSASTEGAYISDIIEKIALSHPEIAFSFTTNGKQKFHTTGNGNLIDTIYTIFGKEISDNIIEVSCEDDSIKMHGYIGKGNVAKGNRSGEIYFINSRFIKNDMISRTIEEGYKNILMMHKYPFTVLNFEIDTDLIDVNVHPAKMELRFRNSAKMHPVISECIREALVEKPNIVNMAETTEKKTVASKSPEPFETKRVAKDNIDVSDKSTNKSVNTDQPKTDNSNTVSEETTYSTEKDSKVEDFTQTEIKPSEEFLTEEAKKKHKIIGQVFDTYWIIEYEDSMYIIDQHAAHEKVMFEKLMDQFNNKSLHSQKLATPIVLNLSMKEADLVEKYLDNFKEVGFDIEHFGGQDFAVRAIPADLYTLDSEEVLEQIIAQFTDEAGSMVPDIINEKIASMSCKAAIKGNTAISYAEADELITQLLSLENPYNCPHGRPTIIAMTKSELDKKFKRII